jgi:hypothetical protein
MSKRNLALLAALIALGVAAWVYLNRGPQEESTDPADQPARRELVEAPAKQAAEQAAPEQAPERSEDIPAPKSMRATVQMRARIVGTENPKWLLLRIGHSKPAARIYPVGDELTESCEADATTGEFNASIEVAAEEVLHLGAYSRDGDLLGSSSTGRGLESDEVFVWEPVLDLEGLYRDYYFTFHPESAQDFPYPHADELIVSTFDAAVKLPLGSASFDYQLDRVYHMRVPATRAILAHLNYFDPGVAGWTIDVNEGVSEQEPELIRLVGRVRVLVPNEIALEASRFRNDNYNLMTNSLGVTDSRDLEPLPDGLHHGFSGFSTDTTSFRIGQRFYRCAFPEGGDYFLDDPAITEVYSGDLARLRLTLAKSPGPDTQVFWRVRKDQVEVSKRNFPYSRGATGAQFDVPIGLIRVEARLGIDGDWVSASIEVPRDGTEHRLVLPD